MQNFHNVSFPDFLARAASASVSFITQICESASGSETRKIERDIPLRKYSIKNVICTSEEYENFISFFQSRRGAGYAFRFKDYFDYKVSYQQISIKDKFIPVKYYEDKEKGNIRSNIFVITESLKLKHNGKNIDFKYEKETGFVLQKSLKEESIVEISFEFDVMVRFNQDEVKYHLDSNGCFVIDDIELIEVLI